MAYVNLIVPNLNNQKKYLSVFWTKFKKICRLKRVFGIFQNKDIELYADGPKKFFHDP